MSEFGNKLAQGAVEIANGFRRSKIDLEKEIFDLEARTNEKKAALHAADLSIERLGEFQVSIGGEHTCPNCWIASGTQNILTPKASTTDADIFRCRVCHFEISS